jgi:hypothetical protein
MERTMSGRSGGRYAGSLAGCRRLKRPASHRLGRIAGRKMASLFPACFRPPSSSRFSLYFKGMTVDTDDPEPERGDQAEIL